MNSFDPLVWSPELRRALISARPDFFGMSPEQQLRFRVKLPSEDRQAIVAALLAMHGHSRPAEAAEQESNGRIAVPVQHRINEWLQPLIGIGEDSFSLNESYREGQSILDFPTLLDYDQEDHDYQEKALKDLDPTHPQRPYAGSMHWTWARCMLGGRLCYLNLSMAASHIVSGIEDLASAEIDRRIPHRYVPRPEHGRVEDGLIRWSQRVDAGGQEALHDELQRRVWGYANARLHDLQTELNGQSLTATFLNDDLAPENPKDEQHLSIVFSDPSALGQVRLTSFLRDCRAMEQPWEKLTLLQSREAERVIRFVNEQHQELMQTFDASVVPLRRRNKVLIHPDAFDALNDEGGR
jgi:hypothetical protein